jgi:beta-1,4-mannosyl-glycoprotein beta-1,4-N-acetylglucosaminyltransferase
MIVDAFPFFNELDVLEIRLAELYPVVDRFVIVECKETYGGKPKPLYFADNRSRFQPWADKITHAVLDKLEPALSHTLHENVPGVSAASVRNAGRAREAYARNAMLPIIMQLGPNPNDVLSFGDCDEIPRAFAIERAYDDIVRAGCARLKQRTYYYNVNTQIDYGRDVCSRARVGTFHYLLTAGGALYENFRMAGNKQPDFPAIEEGGWHFSYFGGSLAKLHEKVAALDPFLQEYKLFGDGGLVQDILQRKDLHRRPLAFSELPAQFADMKTDDPMLPAWFLTHLDRFAHFTRSYFEDQNGVR